MEHKKKTHTHIFKPSAEMAGVCERVSHQHQGEENVSRREKTGSRRRERDQLALLAFSPRLSPTPWVRSGCSIETGSGTLVYIFGY